MFSRFPIRPRIVAATIRSRRWFAVKKQEKPKSEKEEFGELFKSNLAAQPGSPDFDALMGRGQKGVFSSRRFKEHINSEPIWSWDSAEQETSPFPTDAFNSFLEKDDYEGAIFAWNELKEKKFQFEISDLLAFVGIASRQERPDTAILMDVVHVAHAQGLSVDVAFFNEILKVFADHGLDATSLIDKMNEMEVDPNIETYNLGIALHFRRDALEKAQELFEQISKEDSTIKPTQETHEIMVLGYLTAKGPEAARDLMHSLKINTPAISEAFMKFYVEKDVESAISLYQDSVANKSLTQGLFRLFLNGLITRKDFESVEKYLDEALNDYKDKFPRDVLNGLACAYADEEKADEAFKTLEKLMLQFNSLPEEETYNRLIAAFSENGHLDRAEDLVAHMKKHGLKPSSEAYEHLMAALIEKERVSEAFDLLRDLENNGLVTKNMYGILLVGLAAECNYERAIQLWHDLRDKRDMQVDPETKRVALEILLKTSSQREALDLFHEMMNEEISVEFDNILQLFETAVRGRQYKDAAGVLLKLRNRSSDLKLTELMQNYASEWENVLVAMLTSSEKSFQQAYAAPQIPAETLRQAKEEQEMALFVYKELISNNIKLSPSVVAHVIRACHQNQDLVGAVKAWTAMKNQGVFPTRAVVESLLLIVRDFGQEQTSKVIIRMWETEQWPMSKAASEHLMIVMARVGATDALIKLILDFAGGENKFQMAHYRMIRHAMGKRHSKAANQLRLFIEETFPGVAEEFELSQEPKKKRFQL